MQRDSRLTVDLVKASSSRFTPFLTFILELQGMGIREIAALDQCPNLRHLNLSRNGIAKIKGLEVCSALTYVNLAYNQISVVEGLAQCILLKRLELTGNRVANVANLSHIQNLPALVHVSFQTFALTDPNPVCGAATYREDVLGLVPRLKSLDGHRRTAQVMSLAEVDDYDFDVGIFQVRLDNKPWVQDSGGQEGMVNIGETELVNSIAEVKKLLQRGERILQSLQES